MTPDVAILLPVAGTHGSVSASDPICKTADIVCGKWTMLLLRDLTGGPRFFGELQQSLAGISPRTLCERLKFLTEQGLITREYIKSLPPRARYALTDKGEAVTPIVEAMREYGEQWLLPSNDAGASPVASPAATSAAVAAQPT